MGHAVRVFGRAAGGAEVATGVKPNDGPDNAAADLSSSRAHRLQTVDGALYADLVASDESVLREYCRELVRQLAFRISGTICRRLRSQLRRRWSPNAGPTRRSGRCSARNTRTRW